PAGSPVRRSAMPPPPEALTALRGRVMTARADRRLAPIRVRGPAGPVLLARRAVQHRRSRHTSGDVPNSREAMPGGGGSGRARPAEIVEANGYAPTAPRPHTTRPGRRPCPG